MMNGLSEWVKKVLVIDNDPDWYKVVKQCLGEKITVDYSEVTGNGNKLDDIFRNKNRKKLSDYDLIFLDLYFAGHHGDLPDEALGGYQVLQEFDNWLQEFIYVPPVIILSGSYNLDRAIRLKNKFNTFDYLYKPELKRLDNPDFIRKEKGWHEKFADFFGLAAVIQNYELRSRILATRRLVELYPEKFWFGYKFWEIVDHTKEHALGVWRILNDWLRISPFLNSGKKMTDEEIYVLLMSALLHDIGSTGNEYFNDSIDVRRHHGIITGQILDSREWQNYGFPNNGENYAKAVGLISKYHEGKVPIIDRQKKGQIWKDLYEKNEQMFVQYYDKKSFEQSWNEHCLKNISGKPLLLISLLMLADAMNICMKRTGIPKIADYKKRFLAGREREYFKNELQRDLCIPDDKIKGLHVNDFKKAQEFFEQFKKCASAQAIKYHDKLLDHINFLSEQEEHYNKHSAIREVKFLSGIDNNLPLDSLVFEIIFTNKVAFKVCYILNDDISGGNIDKQKLAKWINNDLVFELKNVGDILSKYWNKSKNGTWALQLSCNYKKHK